MISVNLNSGGTATLHNFSNYLLSDVDSINVSFPETCGVEKLELTLYKFFRSVFVTKTNLDKEIDWTEVASRLMSSSRQLRLVVKRKPIGFVPYPDSAPEMVSIYVIETLECGHDQVYMFLDDVEPLVAKRRNCRECAGLLNVAVPKKPAGSVVQIAAEDVA